MILLVSFEPMVRLKSALVLVCFLLTVSSSLVAQTIISKNNHTGSWTNASSWSTATIPNDPLTVSRNINVYGYLTYSGNMVWNQSKSGSTYYTVTVYDTLVITGNLTANNNGHSLSIPSGGLVVIFGNYEVNNKVDIQNGGTLVVMGDLTLNGGSGTDYVDNGGGLYVDGTIGGNNSGAVSDADAVDAPTSTLNGTGDAGEQDLYDFVNTGGANPLPIKLSSFTTELTNNSVVLNWTTLTEENFDYFEIQRADASGEFEVLTTVNGSGNSKEAINYSWVDENPSVGINYYRLESVDYDGYREIFTTKMVLVESLLSGSKIAVGPNPAMANGRISIANLSQEKVSYQLYDLNGHLKFSGTSASSDDIQLPPSVSKGIYILSYEVNGLIKKEKLIVQ